MTLVLMTGASGRVGSVLRRGLARADRNFRLVDRVSVTDVHSAEDAAVVDLTNLDQVIEVMAGVDMVVHLAGIPDEAPFDELVQNNIVATHHVLEAARLAGVTRVVLASSHHVIGCYPTSSVLDTEVPTRPDTNYAVSKVFGEALGRLYHDKWGLAVICARIGSFRSHPEDPRQLSTWLSHRDGIHLFDRSLDARDVGYLIVYGVSANTRMWWHNGVAAEVLGYQPIDDAELYAPTVASTADPMAVADLHGGVFAHPDYLGGRG